MNCIQITPTDEMLDGARNFENGSWLKRMGCVKEHADDGRAAPCAKCHVWNRVCEQSVCRCCDENTNNTETTRSSSFCVRAAQ